MVCHGTNLCFLIANFIIESRSEKPARGLLFTTVQRELAMDKIVIVDAPNYIKGFRYQMYCAARENKIRVCTVSCHCAFNSMRFTITQIHVFTPHDMCRERNRMREEEGRYTDETLVPVSPRGIFRKAD
jgi:protein KTI12